MNTQALSPELLQIHLASQVAQQAHDGLMAVDAEQTVRWSNTSLQRRLGYETLVGVDLEVLIEPQYHEVHRQLFREFMAHGESRLMNNALRVNVVSRDGRLHAASISLSKAHVSGVPGGCLAVATLRFHGADDGRG